MSRSKSHLTVGVAFTSQDWRVGFQRYVRDHAVGVSIRMLRDARMAVEEKVDVLVVDDETSFLGPAFVAAVREAGGRTVGVYDPTGTGDGASSILQRMGVDRLLPSTLAPEELLAEIEELAGDDQRRQFDRVVAGLALDDIGSDRPTSVVAVGGPPGAGATEVAIAVADVLADRSRVLLVDLDEVAPGLARRLQLSLHPSVLTALDQVRDGSLPGLEAGAGAIAWKPVLARPAAGCSARVGFDVLAGLANPRDWHLIQPDEVAVLVGLLARDWDHLVVNIGPHLEDPSRYVDRFASSRTAVEQADHLVGICEGSPRGVLRFLDWLVDVNDLRPGTCVDVGINRALASTFLREELAQHLRDNAGSAIGSVTFLAEDAQVGRSAWDGCVVGRGQFRQGVAALVEGLAPAAISRRRWPAWR